MSESPSKPAPPTPNLERAELPDEPLEIVFANQLPLEVGAIPGNEPDTSQPQVGQPNKPAAVVPGPAGESDRKAFADSASQSCTQQPSGDVGA